MDQQTIIDFINAYGYLGVAGLIAIETIFPPIPSELVLTFTGYLTTTSQLSIWGAIVAATLGAYIGAVVLYWLGRLLNAEQIERWLAGRWGKILHLKASDVAKAEAYFRRKGGWAVFLGRFVPVVRSLISLPAGMVKYPFAKFSWLTLSGTLIWNTVLILVGHYAGQAWPTILAIVEDWLIVIVVVVMISGLIWLGYKYKKQRP